MGQMNVSDGDLIEVISQLTTELFTVLALIPTDTSSGVIRLDRGARDILGKGLEIQSLLNVLNIETIQHLKGQR